METPTSFIAYYRVSTRKQGESGLGLEAQQRAVAEHVRRAGGRIIAEFTEVETGTQKRRRPELEAAIARCRKERATLVIAKLDRLARNVYFISGLMEARVDFVACDMPSANRLTIHILAAVAEEEARMISKRTKEALASAKARGVKLGRYGCEVLAPRMRQEADRYAERVAPAIRDLQAAGHTSVRQLMDALNERGIPTPTGGRWHVPTVHRLLRRIDSMPAIAA